MGKKHSREKTRLRFATCCAAHTHYYVIANRTRFYRIVRVARCCILHTYIPKRMYVRERAPVFFVYGNIRVDFFLFFSVLSRRQQRRSTSTRVTSFLRR